jgi:hypothetical protein
MKMEVASFSETLIHIYQTTGRGISEECDLKMCNLGLKHFSTWVTISKTQGITFHKAAV